MRSIQALSVDGIEKLYIGAPITTISASMNCCSACSDSSARAGSALARPLPSRWGRGSESRSRYWTDIHGTSARQRATMAALSSRAAELAPRADRKSVGEGKSESVRGYLGGRRSSKKKQKKEKQK